MKAVFRINSVIITEEVGMDASTLHAVWRAAIKHGCHIQVPVKDGFINIRSLDATLTFENEGILIGRTTIPPSP